MSLRHASLKKWRYAFSKNTWAERFVSPVSGIYICGDAFGGNSIAGAVKSSDSLSEFLLSVADEGPPC